MGAVGPGFFYHLARSATVAPLAGLAGSTSQRLRLPRITGFLLTGILCGPHLLGVISDEAVKALWPVDFICLSTIAVAAGSELQTSELHRTRKQVSPPPPDRSLVRLWGCEIWGSAWNFKQMRLQRRSNKREMMMACTCLESPSY